MKRTLLISLALLAGCGGAEPTGPPAEQVARDYVAAQKARDGKALCALYSSGYRELIEDEGGSCATPAPGDTTAEFESVEESGDEAVATIDCEDTTASDCSLKLKRDDGAWKVDGSLSPND